MKRFLLFAAVATMFTACTENTDYDNADIQKINPLGTPPANAVYYTTLNEQAIESGDYFDVGIVSNTYENGQGTIICDNNITAIVYDAFSRCYNLTNIAIPNGVTTIGIGAFRDCFSLRSINIPESITSIEPSAFRGCSNLKSIHITDIKKWCKIIFQMISDKYPFCGTYNLYLNGKQVKNPIIPDSITSIGNFAFAGCNLTSVTIPDSVVSIGDYAFNGCRNLENIIISKNTTSIGEYAFYGCNSLKKIIIPKNVTSIGIGAFCCNRLTSIYCKAKTPPSCFSLSILDYWVRWKTLYVPIGCKAAYEADGYWQGAKEIIETDF